MVHCTSICLLLSRHEVAAGAKKRSAVVHLAGVMNNRFSGE